ncbi:MAG: DNA polymerase, partial [Acidobacteria bacterium]|nr:DNA polymerase [Acidobacteriota bacterium]
TWTTGSSELGRVLNGGLDPHLDLAALMMGITYDEALRRKDAGDAEIKRNRTAAKPANFGYPGGLGADAFVDYARTYTGGELRLTTERAREMKSYWTKKWPEMQKYFRFVDSQQRGEGYMVKMFDSGLVRSNCSYTAACNCYFQGLAAHGTKRALYAVMRAAYNNRKSALYGSHPVMFIHDEIIAEVPQDEYHEAGTELANIMCGEMQKVVPSVRITASPAAMRLWKNGRLMLWEPKAS